MNPWYWLFALVIPWLVLVGFFAASLSKCSCNSPSCRLPSKKVRKLFPSSCQTEIFEPDSARKAS